MFIFKRIFIILLIITTILNTIVVISISILWNNIKLEDLSLLYPDVNLKIYDKNDNLIANMSNVYTSYTPYEEIPDVIIE